MECNNPLLNAGEPVLVTNKDYMQATYSRKNQYLFYSNGKIDDNKFGILPGKNNTVVAEINNDNFKILRFYNTSPHIKANNEYYNISNHAEDDAYGNIHNFNLESRGSSNVEIGDEISKKYKDCLTALKFAGDAIHFKLPSFYCTSKEANDELVLSSIKALIGKKDKKFCDLHHKLIENKDVEKYNLIAKDYLLWGMGKVAFVKVKDCMFLGEAYVMPYKENYGKLEDIVTQALSKDFMKIYYPCGISD